MSSHPPIAPAPPLLSADPSELPPVSAPPPDPDTIEILEVVASLTAWWRVGLVTALVAFLLGSIFIFRLHSKYESTSTLLPHDSTGGGGTSSIAAFFTGARPTSVFLPLLSSRSLQDDVVRRTGLMQTLGTHSPAAARGALTGMTRFVTSPDGLITITVRSLDAQQTVSIADAYIDALRSMQEHMAETQAEIQRRYFEQQLRDERDALTAAEQDLERTQISAGVVEAGAQTSTGLSAIASTRAEINGLEVRLAALLQRATEQNPEVQTLRSQIAQLQAQERALQAGTGAAGAGVAAPAGKLVGVNLAIARKQREVAYHAQLVNSLASHFDNLRMADANLGDNFDVLDRATLPEAPTWPPRSTYLALLAAVSLLLGGASMLLGILAHRIWRSPVQRAWLGRIAHNLRHPSTGTADPPAAANPPAGRGR